MADLRVKSTGKEFRRIDEGTAKLLEELFPENIERINPTHQRPVAAPDRTVPMLAVPKWGLKTDLEGNVIAIQCDWARGTSFYDGDPDRAADFKVENFSPPCEVIAAYKARRVKNPDWQREVAQQRRLNEAEHLYSQGGGTWPKAE